MQAEIYTKTNCPYCVRAKNLLTERGIKYKEYMLSPGFNEETLGTDQFYVTKATLLERYPEAKTVPQIWLDDEHIGGYTELAAYFSNK